MEHTSDTVYDGKLIHENSYPQRAERYQEVEIAGIKIDFYIDSIKYLTFNNENKGWAYWPFDKRFHLILNLAVGGTWGGAQGIDPSAFPASMEIDYVRVYKKN